MQFGSQVAGNLIVFNRLKSVQRRVPVNIVIAGNYDYSRPVTLQETLRKFIEKLFRYGILIFNLSGEIVHVKRNSPDDIATDDYGFWGCNGGIFMNVTIPVMYKRRDQLGIGDWVARRTMKIGYVHNGKWFRAHRVPAAQMTV